MSTDNASSDSTRVDVQPYCVAHVATRPNGTKVARYHITPPQRGDEGTVTDLAMYAGQSVDDVKDLPAAGELVARLWTECLTTP